MAAFLALVLSGGTYAQDDTISQANSLYQEAISLIGEQTRVGYQKSLEKFTEARKLYARAGEKAGEAKSLVGMAFVSDSLGDRAASFRFYDLALPIFVSLDNHYWAARVLNNVARLHDDTGNPRLALDYFRRALPLRRAAGDLNGQAVTLNSVGAAYVKLGEFQKGLEHYRQAYDLRSSPEMAQDVYNTRGLAIILNNIGRAYDELGDARLARTFLDRALEKRREARDRAGEATTLNNIGLVEFDRRNLDLALDFYKRSLAIIKELGLPYREAQVLNNIALVYLERKEAGKALTGLKQALVYYRKVGDRGGEAVTLNNIGIAGGLTNSADTVDTLNSALLISRQSGEKSLEALTLNNLMIHWQGSGNQRVAAFYGKQSVNTYQEIRSSIYELDESLRRTYLSSITATYRLLADILIDLGQFAQAKQVLNMLKAEEYFDFVRRTKSEIDDLETKVSLTASERRLIKRYMEIADDVGRLSQEYSQLENQRRKASRAGKKLIKEKQKRLSLIGAKLADANAAFRLFLTKQLINELGELRVREIEYDRGLQAKLKRWGDGTVAIYTVVTKDRYRVVLTTRNAQISAKTDIPISKLNRLVFDFREALQDVTVDPRRQAKQLYDVVLKPIEKPLRDSGARTLIWSLDGVLRYIPVAALSPDGKTYLVEQYDSAVVTSQTRDDIGDSKRDWRALGLGVSKPTSVADPGNPTENLEFAAIPGSERELVSIIKDERNPDEKGLLVGRRFVDGDFTRSAFEEALNAESRSGDSKYSVVHVASHFRLGASWSDSFLLLGNGKYLTLEDISNSPALNFGDVELVTLSACDTAFASDANGKEVDSLAEAIQAKSGKAVLATLWAVVDESTPLLMTEFYRLKNEKSSMTKSDAIREVQNGFLSGRLKPDTDYVERLAQVFPRPGAETGPEAFRFDRKRPFAHPYFWSPFVLIGNWR